MPSRMQYLFDTDVLVTAWNFHYKPSFCGGFWSWLEDGIATGTFRSVDQVGDELKGGKPPAQFVEWVKAVKAADFFIESTPAIEKWRDITTWANDPKRQYFAAAKSKFLAADSADAWLIAYAAHAGNFKIVTNETPAPEAKKDIKLPDAARVLGVETILLHELLSLHSGKNFQFKS